MTLLSVMLIITVAFISFLAGRVAFYRLMLWFNPSRKLKLTYTGKDGVKRSKLLNISSKTDAEQLVELISEIKANGLLKRDQL